jgi:COP9 signalosome complex subunit 4
MSTMLTKTFNDYIIRPAELKEFEAGLEQHQRATGAKGETLLQRAIRDHNVGACGKVSVMSDRTAHGSPI